ncbi:MULTISPECIES: precorrin-8X methylmutase [unclassified Zymobacter]|uniref:precorrin-8X methylmutase n=1 Tax=unclassified Zymobacter TaxID=3048685 RepID=UPI0039C24A70
MTDELLPQRGRYTYERNGQAIYECSFATIRREADLQRFTPEEAHVVVRMIHGCGMVELAQHVRCAPTFAHAARQALRQGAAILCDAEMVERGVTRRRLPANNPVICTLKSDATAPKAVQLGTTRSAAAVQAWLPHLAGSLVVIGNAPTALFHLLELLDAGAPAPAAIIGVPVGFVGAAESKQALAEHPRQVPWLIVDGRLGGSAMAASAVNALSSDDT